MWTDVCPLRGEKERNRRGVSGFGGCLCERYRGLVKAILTGS